MRRLLVPALALLALGARAPAAGSRGVRGEPQGTFEDLAREYLAFHFYFNPVEATSLGVHDYDGRLPNLSQEGIFSLIAAYHQWLNRVQAVDREGLSGDDYWDQRILEYGIRDRLLDLEAMRAWERDPLFYVKTVADALAPLAWGSLAAEDVRMKSVVARERQLPELLDQARANLLNPPRVSTELAIEQAKETIRLVRDDLPRAFGDVSREPSGQAFERINGRTIEELRRFAAWLEEDLLPRSNGDVSLGPDLLEQRFRFHEHLDVSLDDLESVLGTETERYRRWIESEARGMDPSRPAAETIRGIADSLDPDSLPALAAAQVRDARDLVVREDLLTLPEGPLPQVRVTVTPWAAGRAGLNASGPFESDAALSARYEIELPQGNPTRPGDAAAPVRLDASSLLVTTARETYPGRWVQALYLRRVPSGIRRVFRPEGLDGGWGDYAAEMAVDQGLGRGNPAVRISQLEAALLELARLRAALRIHMGNVSPAEAAELIQEVAYVPESTARRVARRVAVNPLSAAAALGKLQIDRLRADYQERLADEGEIYVLGNFHDRLLRLGVPLPMARRILMPGDDRASLTVGQ